jgi:uncharacterized protein
VSASPTMRRADKMMTAERAMEALTGAFSGRLATIGADGYPYSLPLLFVMMDGEIFVHNSNAKGHLRTNVEHNSNVCFEVDQANEVYPYGRFECDSALAYWSVIAFGNIRIIETTDIKKRFCDELMAKYADKAWDRPKGFYPRLDDICVYAIRIERLTGKETQLPVSAERWPAVDKTKSPHAMQK